MLILIDMHKYKNTKKKKTFSDYRKGDTFGHSMKYV